MTIGIRELIQFVVYVIGLMALLFTFRYEIRDLKRENAKLRSVIYHEKGGLNVVNMETCKEWRDVIFGKIRNNESVAREMLERISEMSENIIEIKTLLKYLEVIALDKNFMRLQDDASDRRDRKFSGRTKEHRSDEPEQA